MSTPLTELRLGRPPEQPSEDPELEQRINGFIGTQWNDLKAAYWVYHSLIWESLLMYAGNMWLKWNSDRRSYELDRPEDDFVPRPRINRYAPAIDAIASNFQVIPDVEAVPAPRDDVKKMGIAEVCNELSEYFIKDCALRSDFRSDEDKVGMAGQWLTLAGSFIINIFSEDVPVGSRPVMSPQPAVGMQCVKQVMPDGTTVGCDTYGTVSPEEAQASGGMCPQCARPMTMTDTEQMLPQMDETGEPMMEPITEKRVRCKIEDPLSYYPSPGASSRRETRYEILAKRMTLDQIWAEFGIEDASADSEYPDGWNTTAENALNFFYLGYSNMNLSGKDAAMVIRLYIEPGRMKDFPDGVYAIYINGKCKKCEPWPFGKESPLVKVDFKALPTIIFGRSVAFDLTGPMREFLDISSIIKLHGLTGAVEPIVCQDQDNHSEITGRGDKVITWTYRGPGSTAPTRLRHEQLDPGLYEMRGLLLDDIEQIAQTVAVWRGEKPEGADSGKALDTLRVQAAAMFAGPTKNSANGWKEAIRKGVKIYQKEYTTEQLTRIVGENRVSEIADFKACDLDECIEWIATEQGMPRTREERRQEMIQLFDRGMLDVNDPAVRETAFELFGETGMLGTFNKDATRARYENSNIKQGGGPIFMPEVDDNTVHLQIHGDAIKGMDFLGWPEEAKTAMIQHYLETKQVVGMEQQAQAAAMATQPKSNNSQQPPAAPGQPAAAPPSTGGPQ